MSAIAGAGIPTTATTATTTTPLLNPPISLPAPLDPGSKSPLWPSLSYIQHKLRRITGFQSASSLSLFLLTACVFSAWCLFHLPILDLEGVWSKRSAPGEWYWFKDGYRRWAMALHLWSVIRMFFPPPFAPVLLLSDSAPSFSMFLPPLPVPYFRYWIREVRRHMVEKY